MRFIRLLNKPEFWDIFGIISWIFFIYSGINIIQGTIPPWLGYTMLIIASGGLGVDIAIVTKKFILRRRNVINK